MRFLTRRVSRRDILRARQFGFRRHTLTCNDARGGQTYVAHSLDSGGLGSACMFGADVDEDGRGDLGVADHYVSYDPSGGEAVLERRGWRRLLAIHGLCRGSTKSVEKAHSRSNSLRVFNDVVEAQKDLALGRNL